MTEFKIDGRNARSAATRAKIISACRKLMLAGDFRPSMVEVARAAGCSIRSAFQHFKDVEALHLAALDRETQDGILLLILGPYIEPAPVSTVWAAVFGRPYGLGTSGPDAAVGDAAEAAL